MATSRLTMSTTDLDMIPEMTNQSNHSITVTRMNWTLLISEDMINPALEEDPNTQMDVITRAMRISKIIATPGMVASTRLTSMMADAFSAMKRDTSVLTALTKQRNMATLGHTTSMWSPKNSTPARMLMTTLAMTQTENDFIRSMNKLDPGQSCAGHNMKVMKISMPILSPILPEKKQPMKN